MSLIDWHCYTKMDALDLAQLLHEREISPSELAVHTKNAVELMNPSINAVIEVFDDTVLAPQKNCDLSGRFGGVPLFMKDMGSRMAGRLQENGHSWQSENISDEDDPLTKNYRSAGFNLLGRSACPEDGITVTTSSKKFGDCRNPWNLNHTPGGSSGGASALVASGISPVATSSDGGGSTRFPAAWTGLIGLKTTRGRLPLPNGMNEATIACASEGIVSRSVRDTAAVYDEISRKPLGSGFMPYPEPLLSLSEAIEEKKKSYRIALSDSGWSRQQKNHPEIAKALKTVADKLENMGHQVTWIREEHICDFESLFQGYSMASWVAPIGMGLAAAADAFSVELNFDNCNQQVLNHLDFAKGCELADYLAAQSLNPLATRQWGDFWLGYDLLLCPMTPVLCPTIENPYRSDSGLPFERWFDTLLDACRYTMPANEVGLPAISLPAGLDSNNCPLAVQFYAPWNKEHDLLHIAAQLEREMPEYYSQLAPLNVATVLS